MATKNKPRLKTRSSLALDKTLAQMGMPSLFSSDTDLSGISNKKDLFVSSVAHQAVIDINEEGTEAAAGTAVIMQTKTLLRPPSLFIADHPFLYLIVDNPMLLESSLCSGLRRRGLWWRMNRQG